MVVSSLVHSFNRDYIPYEVDPNLSWIGLANWIPFSGVTLVLKNFSIHLKRKSQH